MNRFRVAKRLASTASYYNTQQGSDLHCPPRLENHYYETIVPDLLLMHYKPRSSQPLAMDTSLIKVFTDPAPEFKSTVTNLFTHENCKKANKHSVIRWSKPIYNPVDYTTLPKNLLINPTPEPSEPALDQMIYDIPFIRKIELTTWAESAVGNKNILYGVIMALSCISGVRASPLFAEKGDATKKIRQGMPLGGRVELSGGDAFHFLDKMKETVLPRIREWKGFEPIVTDGAVSIKLPDTAIGYFPDIEPHFDMFPRLYETKVTIHTSASTDEESISLLTGFGLPFAPKPPGKQKKKVDESDPWAKYRKRGERNAQKKRK